MPLRPDEALDFQLQVALAAEDLGPRNSLRELRRTIVRVQDILDVADVTFTLLEPRGWRLMAVRFDDDVAVILRRFATPAQVVAELHALPDEIRRSVGHSLHLCATIGSRIVELEFGGDGLRPIEGERVPALESDS